MEEFKLHVEMESMSTGESIGADIIVNEETAKKILDIIDGGTHGRYPWNDRP